MSSIDSIYSGGAEGWFDPAMQITTLPALSLFRQQSNRHDDDLSECDYCGMSGYLGELLSVYQQSGRTLCSSCGHAEVSDV